MRSQLIHRETLRTAILAAALFAGSQATALTAFQGGPGNGGTDDDGDYGDYVVVHEHTIDIGPIEGLTTAWHPAPTRSGVPLGTSIELRRSAVPKDAEVRWTGAVEVARRDLDAETFESIAHCVVETRAENRITCDVLREGVVYRSQSSLRGLAVRLDEIEVSTLDLSVGPVVISEARPTNEQTMYYYFREESVAALDEVAQGAFVTSVQRDVLVRTSVTPSELAPLIEWRVEGQPIGIGLSHGPSIRFSEPGWRTVDVGPVASEQSVAVLAYRAAIEGPTIEEGVPLTFEARTDPPGYEDHVTWLSSTKYGSAEPVLGRGPTFTVQFESIAGDDGFYWTGVRCNELVEGQDGGGPQTGACCLADARCIEGVTQANCNSMGGQYQGNNSDCPNGLAPGGSVFGLPSSLTYKGKQIVFVGGPVEELAGTTLRFVAPSTGQVVDSLVDDEGLFTAVVDAEPLPAVDVVSVFIEEGGDCLSNQFDVMVTRTAATSPSNEVPEPAPSLGPFLGNLPASICACGGCGIGIQPEHFVSTREPASHGVLLIDGTIRTAFPLLSFDTRLAALQSPPSGPTVLPPPFSPAQAHAGGVSFSIYHHTLTNYAGPVGESMSHSFNMSVVQETSTSGLIVLPDMQVFPISKSGSTWELPDGFFSELEQDEALSRWVLTRPDGVEYQFTIGELGLPGHLVKMSEPNGNRFLVLMDPSGFVKTVRTDLDQSIDFAYNADCLLESITDPIGREWTLGYAPPAGSTPQEGAAVNLTTISTPATQYVDVPAGDLVSDNPTILTQPRVVTVHYEDAAHPHQMTRLTDPRGATPVEFAYDSFGRVQTKWINGFPVEFDYAPSGSPAPEPVLDFGNLITRVTDREGNVRDLEFHGPSWNPTLGGGRYGTRRTIHWTETGKGQPALRPGEPDYFERRWLQDCDCLAPRQISQPFPSSASLSFDSDQMPVDYPLESFQYNDRRQVTQYEYTGTPQEEIRWTKSYADFDDYSRMTSFTPPRAFDDHPVNVGLAGPSFRHSYSYDAQGNLLTHDFPVVTRGLLLPQAAAESWTYNSDGQVTSHTDENGNVTTLTYYTSDDQSGPDPINTQGTFRGYLRESTHGAPGSADLSTNLTARLWVNAIGMVTRTRDPNNEIYRTEYTNLGEVTRSVEPSVELDGGAASESYETLYRYDGSGNQVLVKRENVDYDGDDYPNDWIDSRSVFDAVNNVLEVRAEVDGSDGNDLISRFAYDGNDQQIVAQRPRGNRTFLVFDERRLPLRRFYGVEPATNATDPGEDYPPLKTDVTLQTGFVGYTESTFDARSNLTRARDGRGNLTHHFYDFRNRRIATRDANGNGGSAEYDDGSLVLTAARGPVSAAGSVNQPLERTYRRYDERGREYQTVLDIELSNDEASLVDPAIGDNSSFGTIFDHGSRIEAETDALGNVTTSLFDAADRLLERADTLNNRIGYEYDANSNVLRVTEIEVPGQGASGSVEQYVTAFEYDALNRRTLIRSLGQNGNSIDHRTAIHYDSTSFVRQAVDAEGRVAQATRDDAGRVVLSQMFDGDPGSGTELLRRAFEFDENSNLTSEIAHADVLDLAGSRQETRYAYDDLDRSVRTIYADSDDGVSGTNGSDGTYDRIEVIYDENSNPTRVLEQRGVLSQNLFDPANRLTEQNLTLQAGIPGETRRTFDYDALDRVTAARNDFAAVVRTYDALSRLTAEEQSIRLDGSGFQTGWQHPISVTSEYDPQSNKLECRVLDGPPSSSVTDLRVGWSYDVLNRKQSAEAAYFGQPDHTIVSYIYHGPWRVQRKALGNGARLVMQYDVKQRVASATWSDAQSGVLAGFSYGYDDVDNRLHEVFAHDEGRADNFGYNGRYEVTGVNYRSAALTDYRVFGGSYSTAFQYDDNYNRVDATYGEPFDNPSTPNTVDLYSTNDVNEHSQVVRDATAYGFSHDRAGNATAFVVRPSLGVEAGDDVLATGRYDADNCLFDLTAGSNETQHYRYDPLQRRVAAFELTGPTVIAAGRRYVYDGWSVEAERVFEPGTGLADGASTLERIYVNGREMDEPLLAAIDGTGDGDVSDSTNEVGPGNDAEYYFLERRDGSIMALLDASDDRRVLEYYRYQVFGSPSVLPVVDQSPQDGLEDTPGSLLDNQLAMEAQQGGDPSFGRVSRFGNGYMYVARRLEPQAGLYFNRRRYVEPTTGRFVQRDPVESPPNNLYGYVRNRPTRWKDPMGLAEVGPDGEVIPNSGAERERVLREIAEKEQKKGVNIDIDGGNVFDVWLLTPVKRADSEDDIRDIIKDAGACIKKFTITAHGVTSSSECGGKKCKKSSCKMALYDDDDQFSETLDLKTLGKMLQGKVCQKCTIVLRSCCLGNKECKSKLQALADTTGCTVKAPVGNTQCLDIAEGGWVTISPGGAAGKGGGKGGGKSSKSKSKSSSSGSSSGGSPRLPKGPNVLCFPGQTLVATEHGPRRIDEIRAGDRVWSFDRLGAGWELCTVTGVKSHVTDQDFVEVTAGAVTFDATGNHPVWVVSGQRLGERAFARDLLASERPLTDTGRWVEARHVEVGDVLLSRFEGELRVTGVESRQDTATVYTLVVPRYRSFAVAESGILVHMEEDHVEKR